MEDKTRNATQVGREDRESGAERKTIIMSSTPQPRAATNIIRFADNRKIVAALITYTWRREGQLFPIYEGHTHVGSGPIKGDADQRECEVYCPQDNLLSGDHALILIQRGKLYIQDLSSVNGTFVNGNQLRPGTTEDLPSPAHIKVGQTLLHFMKFEVEEGEATLESAPARDEKAVKSKKTELI
jgi:hypothetical protein